MDQSQLTKSYCFIANSFCEYFSSVARNLQSKSILLRNFVWSKPAEENLPNQVTESQFTFKPLKESEILKELKILKPKKASGLDNFPPGLLKDAALVLTKPLTFIINLSVETGVVPSEWKVAKVIPPTNLSLWVRLTIIGPFQFSLLCQRSWRK